jgi:menaquinone-dependent protoporphyrinogen IX oxidase
MKAIVVYEAMFGNTEKIARALAWGLERSAEVEVVEVTERPSMSEVDVDLVVVGGPTHVFEICRSGSSTGRAGWRTRISRQPTVLRVTG